MLKRPHHSNEVLRGRKMLVVDDDARNIFAPDSMLENQEIEVISATNGRQAIDILHNTLTIIIMDIMMNEWAVMTRCEKSARFRDFAYYLSLRSCRRR